MITVIVYMPSWPPICVRSSISTIFPAIRNRIPIGAYLTRGEEQRLFEDQSDGNVVPQEAPPNEREVLPHDDGNQAHDSFIEAVEEVPQELALLLHVANY